MATKKNTAKPKPTQPKPAQGKKKKEKSPKRGAWLKKLFALVILLCIVGIPLLAYLNSRIVTVKYEEVYLRDLPDAFDGTTILFVSDIHMMGVNTPGHANALMDSFESLNPDLLLLGGDYASRTFIESVQGDDMLSEMANRRIAFFSALADFNAPMGKFAVAGNHDMNAVRLREECAKGGVTLLQNQTVKITKGEHSLYIMGLDVFSDGKNQIAPLASAMNGEDCVIVLTHEPDAFPVITSSDAANGGKWADLVLAGHMHGGQINLFGWRPIRPSDYGDRYLTGWIRENGHIMLVSNGVGCSTINMRWNAPAQAHLITLRKGK